LVAGVIEPLKAPTLANIREAQARIEHATMRTPLVRLNVYDAPAEIYLKLENLQGIGSFKIRGAANAMRCMSEEQLADGVYTASAGNMAQGVALSARQLQVPCRVIVPDSAPRTKLDAIKRLSAEIITVSYDEWWSVLQRHHMDGVPGVFIHPVANVDVIAGNATIALEILEELPEVDKVLVPYGGGGLSCGIAAAMRALRPRVQVIPCECEAAGPYAASLAAGRPASIEKKPSFVDGIGGKSVLPEMWPMARELMPECRMASVAEIAAAIRLLVERNHIVAEGAGAVGTAVAMKGAAGGGRIVCVVSGGNIEELVLRDILAGKPVS
jgi:threonine dehydratase